VIRRSGGRSRSPRWYGDPGRIAATLDPAQRALLARTLWITFAGRPDGGFAEAALTVAASLGDDGQQRILSVVPVGTLSGKLERETWTATVALTGSVGAVAIRTDGVRFTDPSAAEHGEGGPPEAIAAGSNSAYRGLGARYDRRTRLARGVPRCAERSR
jgi:hypothetical protein